MLYGYLKFMLNPVNKTYSLKEQRKLLREFGCKKIAVERFTPNTQKRLIFDGLLHFMLKPGDTLMVTSLIAFSRSIRESAQVIRFLFEKDITVHILNLGRITNDTIGKIVLATLDAAADLEDNLKLEMNQMKEDVPKMRLQNQNYRQSCSDEITETIMELLTLYSVTEVARMTGLRKDTVFRILQKSYKKNKNSTP